MNIIASQKQIKEMVDDIRSTTREEILDKLTGALKKRRKRKTERDSQNLIHR